MGVRKSAQLCLQDRTLQQDLRDQQGLRHTPGFLSGELVSLRFQIWVSECLQILRVLGSQNLQGNSSKERPLFSPREMQEYKQEGDPSECSGKGGCHRREIRESHSPPHLEGYST